MRIVCISDTHGLHSSVRVPDGDLLVHAGDFSGHGELGDFLPWMEALPHRHKVLVAGNHDFLFEREPERARGLVPGNIVYLQDSGAEIEGLKLWGSPWQPWFFDWAFNLPRGAALRAKWDLIPAGLDLLVTHGPPRSIGDLAGGQRSVGCEELAAALGRIKPRAHVFGHIHEGYGRWEREETRFVNASICDEAYRPTHAPVVLEL